MPNWCDCELRVTGPKDELEKFAEFAASKEADSDGRFPALDANNFIPYPQSFRDQDAVAQKWREEHKGDKNADWSKSPKDGFNSGGYEWCIANWGTKWGFCDVRIEDSPNPKRLFFRFQTAWSPPTPVIQKMSEMFPKLKFVLSYFEGGMCFKGKAIFKAGETVDEMQGTYHGHRGG